LVRHYFASGLLDRLHLHIVVLHQAAQADCILFCLLLHIEDQKRSKGLVIDCLDYQENMDLLITRPEVSRPTKKHT